MQPLILNFSLGKATLISLFTEINGRLSWKIKIHNVMSFCLKVLGYSLCPCQLCYTVLSLKNLTVGSNIILKRCLLF